MLLPLATVTEEQESKSMRDLEVEVIDLCPPGWVQTKEILREVASYLESFKPESSDMVLIDL